MPRQFLVTLAAFVCCWLTAAANCLAQSDAGSADEVRPSSDWESAIAAFEAEDAASPPQKGGVVFLGSSSIRLWDLDRWFPGLGAVNRGFGGSQFVDCVYYGKRILEPHLPKFVVVYSGDNDAAADKSPEQIAGDAQQLVELIWDLSPETRVAFIPAKPSVARWEIYDRIADGNARIEEMCRGDKRLVYIDVAPAMLGADGRPRADLFRDDGLHLNDAGYEIWTAQVQAVLDAWGAGPAGD